MTQTDSKLWCRSVWADGFLRISCFSILFALSTNVQARGANHTIRPDNPLIAKYDGGEIALSHIEEFAREMPLVERVPFTRNTGEWRRYMAGELAKITALTSQAKTMGYQMDPGYLRARDYFINEYLDYLVLRDEVNNRIDLSPQRHQAEYETYKADFWASQTVTFRMIRTRSGDDIQKAADRIRAGDDFRDVEMATSQVSPRFRGTVLGPFPTREPQAVIPPPSGVIEAAMALDEGNTTGPFELGGFHYLVKTERKTAGRQRALEEVAEELTERLRERQSAEIVPAFIERVQNDLAVQADEQLFESGSNPGDILATIGTLKITRQEYTDLNGTPRGPAAPLARSMPTRLKQFILPYMLAEWAKSRGYMDRAETQKAIYYYDLQHLAAKVDMELGMQAMPIPPDDELRRRFEQSKNELRRPGAPEPRFEDHKEDMINAILQARAPEADRIVRQMVLQKLKFQAEAEPVSNNITAMEALVAAKDMLTSGVRLVEIVPAELPLHDGATPYETIGRAPAWRIVVATGEGGLDEIEISGPARLLEGTRDFADISAFQPWQSLLRFDSDALKRHAIDEALGDYIARHDNRVQTAARIRFSYSDDDPTSPTHASVTYLAVPADSPSASPLLVSYSGQRGELSRTIYGAMDAPCLTCPTGTEGTAEAASGETVVFREGGTTAPDTTGLPQ